MEELKDKILREAIVIGNDTVKVDGFLNHMLDVGFLERVGEAIAERFSGCRIDKVLTVESSGIAVACMTSRKLGYPPVVFAKKTLPSTMSRGFFESEARSFTKGTISVVRVSRDFISPGENILIVDDFLAHGEAASALADIVSQAGAHTAGVGIVIEKRFQGGSEKLRELGLKVESLAMIDEIREGRIIFGE